MKYLIPITKELKNFNFESASKLSEEIESDIENGYVIESFSPEYFAFKRLLNSLMDELLTKMQNK